MRLRKVLLLVMPVLLLHCPLCSSADGGGFLASRSIPSRTAEGVPKIIWSYWNDPAVIPKAVQLARASWRFHASNYEIRYLTAADWKHHLREVEVPTGVSEGEGSCEFADWLRLALLATHGGVWIDASIVLTDSLDYLVDQQADLSGVHLDGMLFETFFIAAAHGSSTMRQWRDEFERVLAMDTEEYDRYLVGVRSQGIEALNGQFAQCWWQSESPFHQVVHWIFQKGVRTVNAFTWISQFYLHPCGELWWMRYLKTTVAFNYVVGMTGRDPQPQWTRFGISAQDSKKILSVVSYDFAFDPAKIGDFLMGRDSRDFDLSAARGIKLRGRERRAVEEHASCEPGSAICRIQKTIGFQVFPEKHQPPNVSMPDPRLPEL